MGDFHPKFSRQFRLYFFSSQGKKSPRADSRSFHFGLSDHRFHTTNVFVVCARVSKAFSLRPRYVLKNVNNFIRPKDRRKHFFHFFRTFFYAGLAPPRETQKRNRENLNRSQHSREYFEI